MPDAHRTPADPAPTPASRRALLRAIGAAAFVGPAALYAPGSRADILPATVTRASDAAVRRGLDWLASVQGPRGNFPNSRDGQTYPCAMTALAGMAFLANGSTTSRGAYRKPVDQVVDYLLSQAQGDGLIATNFESGQPMYGHGFSTMFLASAFGMESDRRKREQIAAVTRKAIEYIAMAQSNLGGWYYTANSGDEGSVTVTQMQALRACHNAGFAVDEDVVKGAIEYLEACETPEGGIRYSYNSGNSTRLPITAAAVCCLYSAGRYESELAQRCLNYVDTQFGHSVGRFSKGGGHDYYTHYYAAQSYYQISDEQWAGYFDGDNGARDLVMNEQRDDGHWDGDGIGPVYGTSLMLVVLQLPYRYLPIYQR